VVSIPASHLEEMGQWSGKPGRRFCSFPHSFYANATQIKTRRLFFYPSGPIMGNNPTNQSYKSYEFEKGLWDFKFSRRRVWCSELSSGMYCRIKLLSTDVSEVRTASIIRDDHEAVRTSETSVYNHFTWQCIPEDNSELEKELLDKHRTKSSYQRHQGRSII
jgi:hypothetical protein